MTDQNGVVADLSIPLRVRSSILLLNLLPSSERMKPFVAGMRDAALHRVTQDFLKSLPMQDVRRQNVYRVLAILYPGMDVLGWVHPSHLTSAVLWARGVEDSDFEEAYVTKLLYQVTPHADTLMRQPSDTPIRQRVVSLVRLWGRMRWNSRIPASERLAVGLAFEELAKTVDEENERSFQRAVDGLETVLYANPIHPEQPATWLARNP